MTKKQKTEKAEIVTPAGAPAHVPAPGIFDRIPTIPFEVVKDVALMGVHLGIGLSAIALEQAQKIGWEAIERGAKLEKSGRKTLLDFEREQVASMKEYVKKVQLRRTAPAVGPIEAHVEEALRTHDVPTRDDIRELHLHITSLEEKLASLGK